jgi:CRISPR-associated protein Cas6/Cse3/CasE subtype I-E
MLGYWLITFCRSLHGERGLKPGSTLRRRVAALVSVNISNSRLTRGKLFIEKEDEKRMCFLAVPFEGLLKVKNPNRLLESVRSGIGSGKGLGFGLLSLAPAR